MMKRLAVGLIVVILIIAGCGSKGFQSRLWDYSNASNEGYGFVGLYTHPDNVLVYGFFYPTELILTSSGSSDFVPKSKGISFTSGLRDGLWIDGKKVTMPVDKKIFGITKNGLVVPLDLSPLEIAEVAGSSAEFLNSKLWTEKISLIWKNH